MALKESFGKLNVAFTVIYKYNKKGVIKLETVNLAYVCSIKKLKMWP